MRTEAKIFKELEALCAKPGYVHVLAYLSFRDNFGDDFGKLHERTQNLGRHISMETSTLIGLAVKCGFNTDEISLEEIGKLAEQTEKLTRELNTIPNDMFYDVGYAYPFHYMQLAPTRYTNDNKWFQKHKNFSIQEARGVIKALFDMQLKKVKAMRGGIQENIVSEPMPLHIFMFTLEEVAEQSNCSIQIVKNVVDVFCLNLGPRNKDFNSIADYNNAKSHPIIKINDKNYLLLQLFDLLQSMYESPLYWMNNDEEYKDTADKHRGDFTEKFCADRLESVFGAKNVYKNVEFEKGKKFEKGEIDVLVTYSNRAIVLQAKSKKLTLKARQGDEEALEADFQSAVQKAYDQGFICAELLNDKDLKISVNGKPLEIRRGFREIYIFTVVPEHYPALAAHAEKRLQWKTTETVLPPFVMDIFLLDILCELLETPLYFLDFAQKRMKLFKRIVALGEISILSYYLNYNLYIPHGRSCISIGYHRYADIDEAMHARRVKHRGNSNVEGILTKWKGYTFGKLIQHIAQYEQDGVLDIGFFLLSLNEDEAMLLGRNIEKIIQTHSDGKWHDISEIFARGEGLTFLTSHLSKDSSWEHSDKMEEIVNGFVQTELRSKKVGRNESCPCGSGKKYKHCHGETA